MRQFSIGSIFATLLAGALACGGVFAPEPPASTTAEDPVRVTFTVPGEGAIRCGDGSFSQIVDVGSITFHQLTADGETCVFIQEGRPICAGFIERDAPSCTCNEEKQTIACR
ncbi:MAG: hypothetical protein EA397_16885 [Deltaproteobacteria bacterium]|nr:MAG: hypothetical protein EA397_16885 [Deltaproteobacteria bacterium]